MNKIMSYVIIIAGIVGYLAILPVYAQAPGLPGGPSQVPITGGLAFLAVGGGIYAVKKLRGQSQ